MKYIIKKILLCLIVSLSINLSSCTSNNDQGIKDSNDNFMIEFKNALKENNIPFKVDDEGYVRYSREYKDAVEKIKQDIDRYIANEVGTKFEKKISTEYFRNLLNEKGISYRKETKSDGEWTYWHPENKEQEKEIEMMVVNHAFKLQKDKSNQNNQ